MTSAIILAGGMGTRLRSVVSDRPKPMALIGDIPFLECQINYWIGQGVNHFILSVGYKFQIIQDYFGVEYKNLPIDYAIESSPLGTGGGLLQSIKYLKNTDPFLVLNGDTYFSVPLLKLREVYQNHGADWCISLLKNDDKKRYLSISLDSNNRIQALKSISPEEQLVNGGVYFLTYNALKALNLVQNANISLEEDILPLALAKKQNLIGMQFEETFIDIGIPADLLKAQVILGNQN